ncbi:HEXXH motif domain-containing protein [Nocardia vinacea]|uniref:HEXXH motif domain-containing protein n=1 Tax=Nocardia vinacea TaxID=96468 RepID=UPI0033E4C705
MTTAVVGAEEAAADLSSGHGTGPSITRLVDGMLTVRMILLHSLVAEVTRRLPDTADGAGLSLAYHSLAELQQSHPAEVAKLLSYPHTGPWLARVLQRIQTESDTETTPLWADCGYLGWIAAAAGITCRPEGSMKLVVRNGAVMLPGIGLARLGPTEECGHCELRWTDAGALHFARDTTTVVVSSMDDESDPAWLPLRRVRGTVDEWEVILDDIDPFRDVMGVNTPTRLTAAEAQSWQQDFTAAWDLLRRDFNQYLVPMRSCFTVLAPLSTQPVTASSSYTSATGVGCVYTTAPADPCQLALTLIHEIQHTKFTLLSDQIALFEPDSACRFYAPWRDDPRPILGLLHGIYAFFGVTDFWRVHRRSDCHRMPQAHVDFELWRMQVRGAMTQALASGLLTAAGKQFIDTLEAATHLWENEDVPAEARLVASEASAAHRTFWRVRNLIPEPGKIADLAARWATRSPNPKMMVSGQAVAVGGADTGCCWL